MKNINNKTITTRNKILVSESMKFVLRIYERFSYIDKRYFVNRMDIMTILRFFYDRHNDSVVSPNAIKSLKRGLRRQKFEF